MLRNFGVGMSTSKCDRISRAIRLRPQLTGVMSQQLPGWGVTGWSTQWAPLDAADVDEVSGHYGFGMVRVVDPGVVYCEPPLVEGVSLWTPSPDGKGRSFTMAWPEDEPPRYRTLSELQRVLADRRLELAEDDDDLRQLDDAVLELVRITGRLHKAGGTLGFVQMPSALVCVRRDGTMQIVLPDLGFFWDEAKGLREPKWIAEPSLDVLFEHGARRRNAERLAAYRALPSMDIAARAAAHAAVQAEDVRLLARLIAVALAGEEKVREWCGQGRALLGMPGRDKAPDTLAPVWDQVIAPALVGRIPSCEELGARLEVSRPSEHFLYKPPTPPPLWKRALRQSMPAMAGVLLILAAVAAAPRLYAWIFPPCNPHVLCTQVCASNPMFGRLDELEAIRQRALASLEMQDVGALWDGLSDLADLPEPCRSSLQDECTGLVDKAVREALESLRRRPRPRAEARSLLEKADSLVRRVASAKPSWKSQSRDVLARQRQLWGGPASGPSPSKPESF